MINILELCPCNLTKASLGHQLCGDFYELFGLVARGEGMYPEERKKKTVLTRNLKILINTRVECSLSLYITRALFTQIKIF